MKYLYAGDIATLRGVSQSTARAWMAALERQHGSRVVGRIGKRLFTTERALSLVAPELVASSPCAATLEQRIRRVEVSLRMLRDGLAALDRKLGSSKCGN